MNKSESTERLYHEIACPTLTKTGPCNCKTQIIVADGAMRTDPPAAGPQPLKCIMVDRDAELRCELRVYLDTLTINGDNIGEIRRSLFMPWDSPWNGWVRDETAAREGKASGSPRPEQEPKL